MSNSENVLWKLRHLRPSCFALPDDGRQADHLQRARLDLLQRLAYHANPDGTNCYPSAKTLGADLERGEATVDRRMADLVKLGAVINHGFHVFSPKIRTRVRSISLEWIASQSRGSSSDSPASSSGPRGSSSDSPASSSQPKSEKKPEDDPQPALESTYPINLPPTPAKDVGGKSLIKKHLAAIGSWSKKQERELDEKIAASSSDVVEQALDAVVKEGFDDDVKSKPAVALFRLEGAIAEVVARKEAAVQKAKEDAFQQESIERQTAEIVKRFAKPEPDGSAEHPGECSIEEFMETD